MHRRNERLPDQTKFTGEITERSSQSARISWSKFTHWLTMILWTSALEKTCERFRFKSVGNIVVLPIYSSRYTTDQSKTFTEYQDSCRLNAEFLKVMVCVTTASQIRQCFFGGSALCRNLYFSFTPILVAYH